MEIKEPKFSPEEVSLALSISFTAPNRPSLASPLPAESAEIREIREAETRPKAAESGGLVFTAGEAQPYGLEQLMRASAELLGRGTVGTTYKAVLDNQLVVTVKRLDAAAMAVAGGEVFERHMEVVGELRHRNVVAVRAFFQAKGERLVIYDYQPNGSLYNLIHGSRATRAKPLHWTSCLKIAEDAARGLAYIHGASKLVHGNLKSSNVLLGVDFEARLTDYGLTSVTGSVTDNDPDSGGYRAPETHRSGQRENASADVFSFGILLLELLTGKHPSEHPSLSPAEVAGRVVSADDDGQRGMLAEVARTCTVTSPEQRPAMWQVLKMIQKIKESVGTDLNG